MCDDILLLMTNRESCIRALAYSFDLEYTDILDLADTLNIGENYSIIMPYLERAESLEDIWINCPVMDDGNEF
jgi:hypothetical protein